MKKEVINFSEILNIPGVWVELYRESDTGIWEIGDTKYFVTENKRIINANTGDIIDESTIRDIDSDNKKHENYVWKCCYSLNF